MATLTRSGAPVAVLRTLGAWLGGYVLAAAAVAALSALLVAAGAPCSEAAVAAALAGAPLYLLLLLWSLRAGQPWRQAMAGVHGWTGALVGGLLYTMVWMGTLSVFDREIDRWMMPATRAPGLAPGEALVLDGPVTARMQQLVGNAPEWLLRFPTARVPALELRWRPAPGEHSELRLIDPRTGAVLQDGGTLGASGFIFPFHHKLHIEWNGLGHWLAGFAGMNLLLLLASGVILHRKLIAEFFLFRPRKPLPRASLDLHHVAGVLALPFYAAMAVSGLSILYVTFWPSAYQAAWPQARDSRQALAIEGQGLYLRERAGAAAAVPLASLDAMVAQARSQWNGDPVWYLRVWHAGDRNSHVEIHRAHSGMVSRNLDQASFDAGSGVLLHRFEPAPVMKAQNFLAGLHFAQFDHWGLRWLYFLGGLTGCVMLATGFVFWVETRRAQAERAGSRAMAAVTVALVTGLPLGTLAFFVSNRLLPAGAAWAGWQRAQLEVLAFGIVWFAALAHAWVRRRHAWQEQALAIAVMALLAVALNWLGTGHHLGRTIAMGMWPVAGMDGVLLAVAVAAAGAARRLRGARSSPSRPEPHAAANARGGGAHHA